MKKIGMLFMILVLMVLSVLCSNSNVQASRNPFYVELGASGNIGDINASKHYEVFLINNGFRNLLPVNFTDNGIYFNGRIGYEVYNREHIGIDVEFEKSEAEFNWTSNSPLYWKKTGQFAGTITFQVKQKVDLYTFNSKVKLIYKCFKPYLFAGLGVMDLSVTDRSTVPQLNFDVIEEWRETKLAGKLGVGLEVKVYKHISLFSDFARVHGLTGDRAPTICYWQYGGGARVDF